MERDGVVRVAVAAEQSLVGDSVQAAILQRGFETVRVAWPRSSRVGLPGRATRGEVGRFDVGLLLCELDSPVVLEQARRVLGPETEHWLVLTGTPRGSAWGAVLAAGAREVVSSASSLDEIVASLGRVSTAETRHAAQRVTTDPLVREWVTACEDEAAGASRLASLTPRELQVLEHLHHGSGVAVIAGTQDVTPATVRTQVKAILRKLQVNSQLAAVAMYAEQQMTSAR